jgi:hypothetical protein
MGVNKNKRKKFNDFIMLGRDMLLHCEEWKRLSPAAKLVYIHLKAKHNGSNNGEICLHYSELKTVRGISSPSTVSNAFRELEKEGWIMRTRYGGLYRNPNKYGMTGRFDGYITDRCVAGPEKYKEPTYSEAQKQPPIGNDSMGPEASLSKLPSSDPVRTPGSEAEDSISHS